MKSVGLFFPQQSKEEQEGIFYDDVPRRDDDDGLRRKVKKPIRDFITNKHRQISINNKQIVISR